MSSARSTRVTSLGRALQFSAAAWRDAWLVLALSVAGPAVMFFGEHGPVSRDLGMALIAGGGLWSALMFAPVTAGLYRVALNRFGGPEGRRYPHGLAGLRAGLAEARMLGLAVLMFLLAVLFLAPAALVAAAVAFVFRSQGELSVLAALRYGAYCGLGVLALYPLVALRVALGGAATVAEDQLRLFQTWPLTHKRLLAVALPLAGILLLYPLALAGAAFANQAELGEFSLGPGRWPLADSLAGAALSGLFHGALMPLLVVGALTHLYLEWRPQAPRAATRKPILRVVADLVETGSDRTDDEAAVAAAANDPGADPAVAPPARRTAAAFQIGADRIEWPDHRSVAFETSGQAFGEPAPPTPVPAPSGVWPELEALAMRFPRADEHAPSAAGLAAQPPVFEGEAHEAPRSPIDPAVTALEHPMLLAPDAPWPSESHAPASPDLAPPTSETDAGPADLYVWRQGDGAEGLKDLFWLSGVVPPELVGETPSTAPSPDRESLPIPAAETLRLRSSRPAAANADEPSDPSAAPPVSAVPPSQLEAPPPVEVIAYAAPRPFQAVPVAPVAQAPANDAVTSEPAQPGPTSADPSLARDPVGAAEGHEA